MTLRLRSMRDDGYVTSKDIRQGEPLIEHALNYQRVIKSRSQGIQEVETFKTHHRDFTTGDEVCNLDAPVPITKYSTAIKSAQSPPSKTEARLGRCLHAPDSPQIIEESLKDLSKNHDLI